MRIGKSKIVPFCIIIVKILYFSYCVFFVFENFVLYLLRQIFKHFKIMKRIPCMFNTEELTKELILATRADKLGNVYFFVHYRNNDGSADYARFVHLSSALDFINSNFR